MGYASLQYFAVTLWALLSPFQYGYHTASLNQIQDPLTCHTATPNSIPHPSPCVSMSNTVFGVVTAFFTLGGLLGSASANFIMDRFGRRGALVLNALFITVGSAIFSLSNAVYGFLLARLLIGFGCGLGLCALPIYLAETAPPKLRNRVGVLNQLFITIGILATQAIGLPLAKQSQWRLVLVVSCGVAVLQVITAAFIPDTPVWLAAKGRHTDALSVSRKLWVLDDPPTVSGQTTRRDSNDVERALLDSPEEPRPSVVPPSESISVFELICRAELRRSVIVVALAMITQQGSGINAVIYYSTDILRQALPANAAYISLLISVVNVLMTFAPVVLIERMGQRRLLLASIAGGFASVILLAYGLDSHIIWLSSLAILSFVASFALGMGPIPFMLTAELVPFYAVSPLSSFALSLNWIANFLVGVVFLPLRNLLAGDTPSDQPGDNTGEGQGRVFYVFATILAFCGFSLARMYRA